MTNEERSFDELAYFELNPDVEHAVLAGDFPSGFEHWTLHGHKEGRPAQRPIKPPNAPENWNEVRYLQANPDVWAAVRAGAFQSGYEHWTRSGNDEGRPGSPNQHTNQDAKAVLASVPLGFNCFGYSSAPTGLGSGIRGHLDVFRSLTANVLETKVPVWGLEPPPPIGFDSARSPFALNIIHQNADVLSLFLTHYGRRTLQDRINIGCWVWELHAGYPGWRRFSRLFHEIWVPSHFALQSLSTVCEIPIFVIPSPVDGLPKTPTVTRSDMGLAGNAFVFTYIFDLASALGRKNPLALLRAFRNTFGNRTDVQLVLKYHNVSSDPHAAATIRRLASPCANVRVIDRTLPEDQVYSLLQLSDCFVSPHRSEGFGLNIAAAMYYAKPVIATGYSGNMDYTNSDTAFLIDCDLVTVGAGHPHYREGYGWAEPSVEHLCVLLKQVFDNRELARDVGLAGQQIVRKMYSVEAVAQQVRARLRALGDTSL